MSGTKTDSQPKSSSTEGPPELETPQEMKAYTSDLPGLVVTPEPKPEEPKITKIEAPSVKAALEQLASQQGIAMPQIRVVEDGEETVGELDVGLVGMVVQLGQLGQLAKIRKSLEREHFQGKVDNRDLEATDQYQHIDLIDEWPHTPWATAYFFNRGPDSVYISINKHRSFRKLLINEDYSIDLTKADRRIDFIEYYCDTGETAAVPTIGKY